LKKPSCREEIEKINNQREERRKRMQEDKKKRADQVRRNDQDGIKVDVDFQMMVELEKANISSGVPVRNLIQKLTPPVRLFIAHPG